MTDTKEKIVERNGTIYSQNTSNIGKPAASPYVKPINITRESKELPADEPMISHWQQPKYEPIDPEVITFDNDDIVLQHEYLPLDVTPNKLMPIIDNLYEACEEKMVQHWNPGDLLKLCSRLELLQSKIQTLIIMIKK